MPQPLEHMQEQTHTDIQELPEHTEHTENIQKTDPHNIHLAGFPRNK